jgi:hypothetical protein
MVAAWRHFLDEAEDVLNGKKLLPFWRGAGGKGVNLMLSAGGGCDRC